MKKILAIRLVMEENDNYYKSMLQRLFISDIHYYSIYISFTNNIIIKCLKRIKIYYPSGGLLYRSLKDVTYSNQHKNTRNSIAPIYTTHRKIESIFAYYVCRNWTLKHTYQDTLPHIYNHHEIKLHHTNEFKHQESSVLLRYMQNDSKESQ